MLKMISLYWYIIHLGIKMGFLPGKNTEGNESNILLIVAWAWHWRHVKLELKSTSVINCFLLTFWLFSLWNGNNAIVKDCFEIWKWYITYDQKVDQEMSMFGTSIPHWRPHSACNITMRTHIVLMALQVEVSQDRVNLWVKLNTLVLIPLCFWLYFAQMELPLLTSLKTVFGHTLKCSNADAFSITPASGTPYHCFTACFYHAFQTGAVVLSCNTHKEFLKKYKDMDRF